MKKKNFVFFIFSFVLCFALTFSVFEIFTEKFNLNVVTEETDTSASAASGSWADYIEMPKKSGTTYQIRTANELAWVSDQVIRGETFSGYYFNVYGEIDLSAHYWVPIGDASHPFKASFFRGMGKNDNSLTIGADSMARITGLTLRSQHDFDYNGLFGYVEGTCFNSIYIEGYIYVNNGFNAESVSKVENWVGGFVGYSKNAIYTTIICNIEINYVDNMSYSYSGWGTASVTVNSYIGGLVGYSYNDSINYVMSMGKISANWSGSLTKTNLTSNQSVGGIFGFYHSETENNTFTLDNMISYIEIKSNLQYVGGIFGYIEISKTSVNFSGDFSFNIEKTIFCGDLDFTTNTKYSGGSNYAGGLIGRSVLSQRIVWSGTCIINVKNSLIRLLSNPTNNYKTVCGFKNTKMYSYYCYGFTSMNSVIWGEYKNSNEANNLGVDEVKECTPVGSGNLKNITASNNIFSGWNFNIEPNMEVSTYTIPILGIKITTIEDSWFLPKLSEYNSLFDELNISGTIDCVKYLPCFSSFFVRGQIAIKHNDENYLKSYISDYVKNDGTEVTEEELKTYQMKMLGSSREMTFSFQDIHRKSQTVAITIDDMSLYTNANKVTKNILIPITFISMSIPRIENNYYSQTNYDSVISSFTYTNSDGQIQTIYAENQTLLYKNNLNSIDSKFNSINEFNFNFDYGEFNFSIQSIYYDSDKLIKYDVNDNTFLDGNKIKTYDGAISPSIGIKGCKELTLTKGTQVYSINDSGKIQGATIKYFGDKFKIEGEAEQGYNFQGLFYRVVGVDSNGKDVYDYYLIGNTDYYIKGNNNDFVINFYDENRKDNLGWLIGADCFKKKNIEIYAFFTCQAVQLNFGVYADTAQDPIISGDISLGIYETCVDGSWKTKNIINAALKGKIKDKQEKPEDIENCIWVWYGSEIYLKNIDSNSKFKFEDGSEYSFKGYNFYGYYNSLVAKKYSQINQGIEGKKLTLATLKEEDSSYDILKTEGLLYSSEKDNGDDYLSTNIELYYRIKSYNIIYRIYSNSKDSTEYKETYFNEENEVGGTVGISIDNWWESEYNETVYYTQTIGFKDKDNTSISSDIDYLKLFSEYEGYILKAISFSENESNEIDKLTTNFSGKDLFTYKIDENKVNLEKENKTFYVYIVFRVETFGMEISFQLKKDNENFQNFEIGLSQYHVQVAQLGNENYYSKTIHTYLFSEDTFRFADNDGVTNPLKETSVVEGFPASILYNAEITLMVAPQKGYVFLGWYDSNDNLVSTNAEFSFNQSHDYVVVNKTDYSETLSDNITYDCTTLVGKFAKSWLNEESEENNRSSSYNNDSYGENSSFEIKTRGDLLWFANQMYNGNTFNGKSVYLKASIDLADYYWESLGSRYTLKSKDSLYYVDHSEITSFQGRFYGNGYTLFNMHTANSFESSGLFIKANNAIIQNVNLINCSIGSNYVGQYTIKENVFEKDDNGRYVLTEEGYVEYDASKHVGKDRYSMKEVNTIVTKAVYDTANESMSKGAGGIVGIAKNSTIMGCYVSNSSDYSIRGYYNVGGIVGVASNCNISKCYVVSSIFGVNSIGGIIGNTSYIEADIEKDENGNYVIINGNYVDYDSNNNEHNNLTRYSYNDTGLISECYISGTIGEVGTVNVGAIVGLNSSSISDCHIRASINNDSVSSDEETTNYICGNGNSKVTMKSLSYSITINSIVTKSKVLGQSSENDTDTDLKNMDLSRWCDLNGEYVLRYFYWAYDLIKIEEGA